MSTQYVPIYMILLLVKLHVMVKKKEIFDGHIFILVIFFCLMSYNHDSLRIYLDDHCSASPTACLCFAKIVETGNIPWTYLNVLSSNSLIFFVKSVHTSLSVGSFRHVNKVS